MRVIAQRTDTDHVFLVDIGKKKRPFAESKAVPHGQVIDTRQKRPRAGPMPIQSILARGYWEKPTASVRTKRRALEIARGG